ncbi:MAG: SDR family NAD(P)-dependent oxidoreductase [Bacteroidales bacterium]
MAQRKAIVTGAYGAIGEAIARGMAENDHDLTLVGRDSRKLERLAHEIRRSTSNNNVHFSAVDLSRKAEIEAFASAWKGPLHVLINNAAVTPRQRQETDEGIELQFATNVLGYVWMMEGFIPFMEDVEDARIVNVASHWAGDLDLDDLEFKSRRYDNDTAYRQSKQANRMLTAAYAERLKKKGISVVVVHPGNVSSRLSNNLGYGGFETPEKGAETPLTCALNPHMKGVTGVFYENRKQQYCPFMEREEDVEQLYEICQRY